MRRWLAVSASAVLLVGCGGQSGSRGTGTGETKLVPGHEAAQTFNRQDPAHDVVLMYQEDLNKSAPAYRAADITAAVFSYTKDRVTVGVTLRQYAGGRWIWSEVIKSSPTRVHFLIVTQSRKGDVRLLLRRSDQAGEETITTCPGMSVRIRPFRNTIRVAVPATCLKRPRWVRVGLGYYRPVSEGSGYVDDSLIKGTKRAGGQTWTPRLYAG